MTPLLIADRQQGGAGKAPPANWQVTICGGQSPPYVVRQESTPNRKGHMAERSKTARRLILNIIAVLVCVLTLLFAKPAIGDRIPPLNRSTHTWTTVVVFYVVVVLVALTLIRNIVCDVRYLRRSRRE